MHDRAGQQCSEPTQAHMRNTQHTLLHDSSLTAFSFPNHSTSSTPSDFPNKAQRSVHDLNTCHQAMSPRQSCLPLIVEDTGKEKALLMLLLFSNVNLFSCSLSSSINLSPFLKPLRQGSFEQNFRMLSFAFADIFNSAYESMWKADISLFSLSLAWHREISLSL